MAFNRDYLSQIGPGGGKTGRLWSYRTLDASTVVDTAGYFAGTTAGQDASDVLEIGDVIISATVGGTVDTPTSATTVFLHIVASNDGTTVDVTNGIAITATDGD